MIRMMTGSQVAGAVLHSPSCSQPVLWWLPLPRPTIPIRVPHTARRKGRRKRPCRGGHTLAFVGGKYTPVVGEVECLTGTGGAASRSRDEYCTPAQDGKEKYKETVKIDLSKQTHMAESPVLARARRQHAVGRILAMNDTAVATRGDMAKVQEIANQTKANPEVSVLINSAFSNIKPSTAEVPLSLSAIRTSSTPSVSLDPNQTPRNLRKAWLLQRATPLLST